MNPHTDRLREWWDLKAPREEQDRADERVNRELRWREIGRRLDGVRTIADIGGGTGAFSIPLARRGYQVTHIDISPVMLDLARQRAGGLSNLRFVQADATDLTAFADGSFDLVLNMDGAISFSGREANRAIQESCRLARRTVLVTTSNRASLAAGWVGESLAGGRMLPAVDSMFNEGWWDPDEFESNCVFVQGRPMNWIPPLRAYNRQELMDRLKANGFRVIRAGGLGSLANLLGCDRLAGLHDNDPLWRQFIAVCDRFDQEIMPDGPGTWERAGLIGVAVRDG